MSNIKSSPDYFLMKKEVNKRIHAYKDSHSDEYPGVSEVKSFFNEAYDIYKSTFKKCGIKTIGGTQIKKLIQSDFIKEHAVIVSEEADENSTSDEDLE